MGRRQMVGVPTLKRRGKATNPQQGGVAGLIELLFLANGTDRLLDVPLGLDLDAGRIATARAQFRLLRHHGRIFVPDQEHLRLIVGSSSQARWALITVVLAEAAT